MKNNYFNVIIPTRNRLETLRYSLQTALNQDYINYKIIISDNNSTDGTRDFVSSLHSEKIAYFNTGGSLSMSGNFEFALSKSKEGFVILIGDDDGLLPNALNDINGIIHKEKTLAISSRTALYYWPGGSPYEDLLIIPSGERICERRASIQYLKKVLNGDLNYPELPMLYTGGVVHTRLIEKAKEGRNKFFHSFTPDVYSGIAIASVVDEYTRTEKPFAIAGLSKYSNGQSQLGTSNDTAIAQIFLSENDIPFYPSLGDGKTNSLHLLTLEAYLQSGFLRTNEKVDLLRQFEIVIAKTSKKTKKETKNYLRLQCGFRSEFLSKSQFCIVLLTIIFALKDAFRLFKKFMAWDMISVKGIVKNVEDASLYISQKESGIVQSIFYKFKFIKFAIHRRSLSFR
jgi:glycosyltransferase involved in cell wall biosynthesis